MSQAAVTCPAFGEKLIELAGELALGETPRLRPLAKEVRDLAYRVDCPAEAAAISRVRADALDRAVCQGRGEVLAELASSGTEVVEPGECGERGRRSSTPRRQLFPLPSWARRSMESVWLNTGGLETGDQRWSDLVQVRTLCASIQTGLDPRSVSGRRIPLDPQRTAEKLRMLGERFKVQRADGGPDKADDAAMEPRADGQRMPWQEAQRLAEQHVRQHGDAFPGVKRLADIVGCSRPTIDKAVNHSAYLKARKAEAARGAGGRTVQMPEVMLEWTAQTTEDQPDEIAEEIERLTAEQATDQRGDEWRPAPPRKPAGNRCTAAPPARAKH